MSEQQLISIGKISGLFGVKGWVKVFSYTDPKENILNYSPWILKKAERSKLVNIVEGKRHGKAVIVRLEGIKDRDLAAEICGWDIFIEHGQLPAPEAGEYYWTDLVGLQVETVDGVQLGAVDHLLRTGANDVLVVVGDRERLVPFLQGRTIVNIDLAGGKMIVDWDPDF